MIYKSYGNTGIKVSILGFGAMRLPKKKFKGESRIDEEKSIEIIHEGFKRGINYIDTAYPYCNKQSEMIVGKAISDWSGKIYVSTKIPTWLIKKRGDYRKFLEMQLKRLKVDYIDFYHFHGLDKYRFKDIVLKNKLLEQAQKIKEEGLIKFISFSFHDLPEVMKKIIDTEAFDTVLCQYSVMDITNEKSIAYANKKGLGVAVMGPLGGGRILNLRLLKGFRNMDSKDLIKLGLKFVFSNKNISLALSGMESLEMVRHNTEIAGSKLRFTKHEKKIIKKLISLYNLKRKDLIECNYCNYCIQCPENIPIPKIFRLMNYYTLTGLEGPTKLRYKKIHSENEGNLGDSCIECLDCEENCPQNIEITKMLKKIHNTLYI